MLELAVRERNEHQYAEHRRLQHEQRKVATIAGDDARISTRERAHLPEPADRAVLRRRVHLTVDGRYLCLRIGDVRRVVRMCDESRLPVDGVGSAEILEDLLEV